VPRVRAASPRPPASLRAQRIHPRSPSLSRKSVFSASASGSCRRLPRRPSSVRAALGRDHDWLRSREPQRLGPEEPIARLTCGRGAEVSCRRHPSACHPEADEPRDLGKEASRQGEKRKPAAPRLSILGRRASARRKASIHHWHLGAHLLRAGSSPARPSASREPGAPEGRDRRQDLCGYPSNDFHPHGRDQKSDGVLRGALDRHAALAANAGICRERVQELRKFKTFRSSEWGEDGARELVLLNRQLPTSDCRLLDGLPRRGLLAMPAAKTKWPGALAPGPENPAVLIPFQIAPGITTPNSQLPTSNCRLPTADF
jgi:hypothetical protein